MKDIYNIKGPLNLGLLDSGIIFISILLSLLLALIILTIKWYLNSLKKESENQEIINEIKHKYSLLIQDLNPSSSDFFQMLNFHLRSFLEEYNILPGSITMTAKQIIKSSKTNEKLSSFAKECEKFEFSNKGHSIEQINELRQKALYIIKNI